MSHLVKVLWDELWLIENYEITITNFSATVRCVVTVDSWIEYIYLCLTSAPYQCTANMSTIFSGDMKTLFLQSLTPFSFELSSFQKNVRLQLQQAETVPIRTSCTDLDSLPFQQPFKNPQVKQQWQAKALTRSVVAFFSSHCKGIRSVTLILYVSRY